MEFTLFNSNLRLPFNLPPEKLNHFISINIQVNKNIDINNINLYWGYFNGNARVKSTGKWKEVDWITCDKYVPYALGGGYILSKELVSFLGKNADYFRTFNSEDTSVGLWLSSVNNIVRIHDIRFDTEWTSRGCKNFYLVTHNISPKEMSVMYDNLINNKQLCTKEEEKRKYYLYDWSSPPSQCCLTN
ncbi:hypothetical protein GWI33_007774 [Rhynchophorus ferrugineus]|uniref:Hexosyltransferase n=1 Tax=Rhynchophorus ferrugineus TaxID=354439 RepID=A0A834IJN6_RHYFE|nr:hypothetical protein GWI33_007774 [Rhynchophorus ferrugineus]